MFDPPRCSSFRKERRKMFELSRYFSYRESTVRKIEIHLQFTIQYIVLNFVVDYINYIELILIEKVGLNSGNEHLKNRLTKTVVYFNLFEKKIIYESVKLTLLA